MDCVAWPTNKPEHWDNQVVLLVGDFHFAHFGVFISSFPFFLDFELNTLLTFFTTFCQRNSSGADPGEVKWWIFTPPFSEPPSFSLFLSFKYWNNIWFLWHCYKNSPPSSKSWIRPCSYCLVHVSDIYQHFWLAQAKKRIVCIIPIGKLFSLRMKTSTSPQTYKQFLELWLFTKSTFLRLLFNFSWIFQVNVIWGWLCRITPSHNITRPALRQGLEVSPLQH